ncbi:methyl-accepting chemotaxis protein [Roseibacterium sp. SDUM158017]|uniref:methyl-accepting chemotaxis protein n=1 Tax=Roseicyclus salinarum TaxID=3036773 RepID=UPI002415162A|nr:methyl-accepting chemotaxis protein [Roseibacterium sp. SDUM158017]MDG4648916.1 methyl-accepting chemotaxis protein [Roseibacterium sp. SDUM158017]
MAIDRLSFANSSVFVKCIVLIVGATLLVASVLSALSIRTVNGAIDDGIRTLGDAITSSAATANGAALRFGNAEAVQASLQTTVVDSDAALMAVAVNGQGEAVTNAGDGAPRDAETLRELARRAVLEAAPQVSADGMSIAYPSFVGGAGDGVAGAVAILWTPDESRANARTKQMLNLAVSGLVLFLLVFGASVLLKMLVSRPITVLAEEIATLRSGRYDAEMPFADRGDEIGTIARNLAELQHQLAEAARATEDRARIERTQKSVVEELTVGLQTVANGDLTRRIEVEFAPEYETLRRNFNETVDTIVRVIEQIARNAETIRLSADGIAQSSDELSKRTENQAASLEETAAALDMITTNVENSAGSARNVERIVVDAKSRAQQSSSVVQKTVDAMAQIEESSRQISRISTVIDEIAFQTNLLALNAGVEAARAGDAGRGFSVVANEVRALAQRSSDAANEIKTLIGLSSGYVERGVELVGSAGNELNEITQSVSTISTHVEGISKSAGEQSASLAEVNSGVAQLDRVTQQNAAMVSQANESSQTLKNEAKAMAEIISVFKLPGRQDFPEAEGLPRLAG